MLSRTLCLREEDERVNGENGHDKERYRGSLIVDAA